MAAKTPNDIYQFSLLNAYHSGLTLSGPPVRALQGYGTDGIGYLPRNSGELLFLDSTAYSIAPNDSDRDECHVEHAKGDIQLPFVMVTKYVPEFSLEVNGEVDIDSLMDVLGCEGPIAGGKNSFMPFRVRGTFSRVEFYVVGHELVDVKGTVFGFVSPKWAKHISVTGVHCYFLSERDGEGKLRGGKVKQFKTSGGVELTWSLTGRFHLGLPSGEEWEDLDL
jgi:acetolactate decarboxylase